MTRVRLATFEDDAPRTEARATDASCGIGRGAVTATEKLEKLRNWDGGS
jgi:hypothetical protein